MKIVSLEVEQTSRETSRNRYDDVLSWRIAELVRFGFGTEAAIALALSPTVDLHDAERLVRRGCPLDTAVRILL